MDPIDDEIICCICHEILHNLHDKVTTICKHTYCVSCFIKWMRISNNCAYCKNNLINNTKIYCPECRLLCSCSFKFCPSCGFSIKASVMNI